MHEPEGRQGDVSEIMTFESSGCIRATLAPPCGAQEDYSEKRVECQYANYVPLYAPKVLHHARPQRIEVDITDQFEKIWLFFTEKRLVAVLVKMAMPPVAPVELLGVSGEYSSHYRR